VVGSFNGDENTTFYAVFDGHGGSKCSQYLLSLPLLQILRQLPSVVDRKLDQHISLPRQPDAPIALREHPEGR